MTDRALCLRRMSSGLTHIMLPKNFWLRHLKRIPSSNGSRSWMKSMERTLFQHSFVVVCKVLKSFSCWSMPCHRTWVLFVCLMPFLLAICVLLVKLSILAIPWTCSLFVFLSFPISFSLSLPPSLSLSLTRTLAIMYSHYTHYTCNLHVRTAKAVWKAV